MGNDAHMKSNMSGRGRVNRRCKGAEARNVMMKAYITDATGYVFCERVGRPLTGWARRDRLMYQSLNHANIYNVA